MGDNIEKQLLLSVLFGVLATFVVGEAWAEEAITTSTSGAADAPAAAETAPTPSAPVTSEPQVPSAKPELEESTQVQLLRPQVEALSKWVTTSRLEKQNGAQTNAQKNAVEILGYLRSRYGAVLQSDENPDFVGQNDGFRLDNARLQVDVKHRTFTGRFSIDGAVDQRDADNTSNGLELACEMPGRPVSHKFIRLGTGQFKPAFDGEELRSTKDMTFIERAVESRGIRGVEG